MLKKIGQLFGSEKKPSAGEKFGEVPLAQAVLLLEMVHADFSGESVEDDFVFRTLQRGWQISAEQARSLIDLAHEEREKSVDLHKFTRQINDGCTREEKLSLLETLWRLVYVDGEIDKYEEALMRRITTLLRLSHRQMIEVKLKVCKDLGLESGGILV